MKAPSYLALVAFQSLAAFAPLGFSAAADNDALAQRLDSLEATVQELREMYAPLLSDATGKPLPSNIVVERVERDANAELVVKARRPCRVMIVSRFIQRSTINVCELRVNGTTRDVVSDLGGRAAFPQRSMSTVVDVDANEVLRIEVRKIEQPIKFDNTEVEGVKASHQNLRNNTITVIAMPLLHDENGEQDGADRPATAPDSKPEGNENPEPESEVRPQ